MAETIVSPTQQLPMVRGRCLDPGSATSANHVLLARGVQVGNRQQAGAERSDDHQWRGSNRSERLPRYGMTISATTLANTAVERYTVLLIPTP
jgi:hypothetical protein